jgi:hypothetical protein
MLDTEWPDLGIRLLLGEAWRSHFLVAAPPCGAGTGSIPCTSGSKSGP